MVLSDYVVCAYLRFTLHTCILDEERASYIVDHLLLQSCLAGTDGRLIQCLVILHMDLNIVASILDPRPIIAAICTFFTSSIGHRIFYLQVFIYLYVNVQYKGLELNSPLP